MKDKVMITTPGEALNKETDFRRRQAIDRLAAKGLKAAEIAQELNLSVTYVGNVITGG